MFDMQYRETYVIGAIQNAAKSFCTLWSFVAWSSMTYIENIGVGDLVLLRCSLP